MSHCRRRCVVGRLAEFPVRDKRFVPRRTGPMCCHGTSQASREGYNVRSTRDETDVLSRDKPGLP